MTLTHSQPQRQTRHPSDDMKSPDLRDSRQKKNRLSRTREQITADRKRTRTGDSYETQLTDESPCSPSITGSFYSGVPMSTESAYSLQMSQIAGSNMTCVSSSPIISDFCSEGSDPCELLWPPVIASLKSKCEPMAYNRQLMII